MYTLEVDQVREGVIALRKPTSVVYQPMTLHEFRCIKHNIFLRKKDKERITLSIRNDGRDIHGENIQMVQVDLSKEEVQCLINELQNIV